MDAYTYSPYKEIEEIWKEQETSNFDRLQQQRLRVCFSICLDGKYG